MREPRECGRLQCALSYPHKHSGERYDKNCNWLPKRFIWIHTYMTESGNMLMSNGKGKYWVIEL